MADPFTPGVHIVTCDEPTCASQYIQMCEDLENIGIVCVEEGRGDYGMGSFKDKFKWSVESNLYTVIHLCPEMINKLGPVEHLLGDDRYKAKYMYINTTTTPRHLPKVYKEATRVRLFTESDYKNIVGRLTKYVHAKLHKSSSAPQLSSAANRSSAPQQPPVLQHQAPQQQFHVRQSPEEQSPSTIPPSAKERGEWQFDRARSRELDEDDEIDGPQGDTFFESVGDVHYLNSRLQHSDPGLLKFTGSRDLIDICSRSELYTRENRAQTILWLQATVLPEVARSADVASLVILLKSEIDLIREKAQLIFMKVLFSKEIGDMPESPIKAAEHTLCDQVLNLHARKDSSHEGSALISIYLVTVLHKIASLVYQHKPTAPFFTRRLHVLQVVESNLNDVIAFVEDFRDRKDLYVRALKTTDFEDFQNKKSWQSQFVVALRTIMEIFHGDKESRLLALQSLMKLLKNHKSGLKKLGRSEVKPHPRVGNLVVIGITCFLQSIEERTGEDLQKETTAAFKVLRQCPDVLSGNVKFARYLVFCSNDLIRQEGISLLTTNNPYSDIVHYMALSDVSEKLQPINIDLTEAQRKSGSPKSNSWLKLPVGRVSERVMLHIHLPKEADHSKQMESTLDSNCGHHNTIEILRMLNSQPHILPLFAFRLAQIPVFYVTEDYSQPNLKQVLFFKAKDKQFLQPVQLLELLLQALDALEYLQRNWIIHRDITASSFTYNREHNQVKLFKFDLARRCELNQVIVDRNCSGIPTRWSAPESLSQCHFTFRSDNWMVGHLIYEVITHGTLPYSDLDRKSEVDVAELIKRGTKKLPQERCIPTKVFVAIADCTKPNENERMSLFEARCQLEETQYEYSSSSHRAVRLTEDDFPKLSRMAYHEPHRGSPGEFASKGVFPRTTSKMCVAEMEADSDEILLEANTKLLSKIPTIFRVVEGETKIEIREAQRRRLTQEEESFLLTNKLDGLYDHVTVVKYEDGEALSYSIPKGCQGNLQSLVENRSLGEDSLRYIQCLLECAQTLVKLHSRRWIHGALSARNIWIQFPDNRPKVFFSELAYMRESRDDGSGIVSDKAQPPEEEGVIRRSAPEVLHGGTYSPACDVYSFALVVWEVLAGLDDNGPVPNKLKEVPESNLYEYLTTKPGSELQPRPRECPQEIYSLLKMCWGPERHDRPSMTMVYTKLNEYITSKSTTDNSVDDIYAEYVMVPNVYEDIANIDHDGPDYSLGSESQVRDIGDIAPSSLPNTASIQDAELPDLQMSDFQMSNIYESRGKKEHIAKFLSGQPDPPAGSTSNQADQPHGYKATSGRQFKLSEHLHGVGAPAAAKFPFISSSYPRTYPASVATSSEIGSDMFSQMRVSETFKDKPKPTVPPKPPPHLRIYRPPSSRLQDTSYKSGEDDPYKPPSKSLLKIRGDGSNETSRGSRQTSPETFWKPRGDSLETLEAHLPGETAQNPYQNYQQTRRPVKTESSLILQQEDIQTSVPASSSSSRAQVPSGSVLSESPKSSLVPEINSTPISVRPNVPQAPSEHNYAYTTPIATGSSQTVSGLAFSDNGTKIEAPLAKPPPLPVRRPPHRNTKNKK